MSTKKVVKKVVSKPTAKTTPKKVENMVAKKTVRPSAVKKNECVCSKTCKASHAFWVNNGPVVRSLEELLLALKEMTDEQFAHHTQRGDGNDFANWMRDCLLDEEGAKSISKARTRVGTVRILSSKCASCKK
jgi:hypothetical protein